MSQQFLSTPGGNIYPDPDSGYDQSEAFRRVAFNRDAKDQAIETAISTISETVDEKADKGDLSGPIPQLSSTDLNQHFSSGRWLASSASGVTNFPPQLAGGWGVLTVWVISGAWTIQEWMTRSGRKFGRSSTGTEWTDWEEWSPEALMPYDPHLRDVDLDTVYETTSGWAAASNGVTNFPPQLSGFQGYFESIEVNGHSTHQWWRTSLGVIWHRKSVTGGAWGPWTLAHDPSMSEVRIFVTQADALHWEENNPGATALYLGEG